MYACLCFVIDMKLQTRGSVKLRLTLHVMMLIDLVGSLLYDLLCHVMNSIVIVSYT